MMDAPMSLWNTLPEAHISMTTAIVTGSIVTANLISDGRVPFIMASNNLYHNWATTETLGRVVAERFDLLLEERRRRIEHRRGP